MFPGASGDSYNPQRKGRRMDEDSEKDFERMLDETMEGITGKLAEEAWEDIRHALREERSTIYDIDTALLQAILEKNITADEQCDRVLALAKPETENLFWEEFNKLRNMYQVIDEELEELFDLNISARAWLRPYFLGYLSRCKENTDFLSGRAGGNS